jgi:hypothetical protein
MRAWLYETLVTDPTMIDVSSDDRRFGGDQTAVRDRVLPRRGEETINGPRPFVIYGLGNATNEHLADDAAEDHTAYRQFFTIWIHDEGPWFGRIDDAISRIKRRLVGASDPDSGVMEVIWLENSQEFNNDTYNTIFRYMRFQAVIGKSGAVI